MDSDLSRRSRSVRQANAAGLSRRIVLRRLAGMASLATGIRAAWAEDRSLDALIGDVDRSGFGQGFDQASRTVHMAEGDNPDVIARDGGSHAARGRGLRPHRCPWRLAGSVESSGIAARYPSCERGRIA